MIVACKLIKSRFVTTGQRLQAEAAHGLWENQVTGTSACTMNASQRPMGFFVIALMAPKLSEKFALPAVDSKVFSTCGFEGLQPVLERMVFSLNMAYDEQLPKSGVRFCVCEIGGDWSWNRFFWQMACHWNSHAPCPFCPVQKFGPTGYGQLPPIEMRSNVEFISQVVGSGLNRRVNPFVLLRNFHVSLIEPCQLHNLNLGLLWTSNGGAVATFGELGYFGDPTGQLSHVVECAWDDFKAFLKQEGRYSSQSKFTIKMIFKQTHGAYFTSKGHNARVLADWLADCAIRAWEGNFGGGRLFGAWLVERPHLLQLARQDEQIPLLCFALQLAVCLCFDLFEGLGGKLTFSFHDCSPIFKPRSCLLGFLCPATWLWKINVPASCA